MNFNIMSVNMRYQICSVARGLVVRWSSTDSQHQIVIPKRIPRTSTDILRALASTVKRDNTAAHFKYHDDPYLIPTSNITKRTYAMAQEAGRKAAYWIRQEHAELFQHRVADPPIQAFFPRATYDENSQLDETVLQKAISEWSVSDAINIYEMLENKGVEVTRDTKQCLLELLCFYNSEDTLQEEWIEERWFRQSQKGKWRPSKSWKDNGMAESIFNSLSPADSASYSTLIAGMALHGQYENAHRKYKEAKEAQIPINIDAYNCLISGTPFLKESHEMRWDFVEEMLKAIKEEGIMPSVGTLNAVLETLSTMPTFRQANTYALRAIAEFKTLGIEPSLASYFHILNLFCRERGGVSSVLVDIINVLEKKKLTIQDPKDTWFFTKAMDVCRFHLVDKDLAYRVDALLHTADNYNFIGDSYKESVYYRNFFLLLCQNEPLDSFMTLYNKLVPNIYVPEPTVMEEVLKTVDFNGAPHYLPQLWSDLIKFDYTTRESVITAILSGLKNNPTKDEKLCMELADIATAILHKIDNQHDQERPNKQLSWTASMLGDIIHVVLRGDKFDEACKVLSILDKKQNQILGAPSIDSLSAFLDACISKNNVSQAIKCIQYCYDAGFPDAGPFTQKLNTSLRLSEHQQIQLSSLVGKEFLERKDDSVHN